MMRILALGRDEIDAKPVDFGPYLEAEARRVRELLREGNIREIYFRADRRDAVLLLECRDMTEAEGILNTLPLVKHKLIRFEIIPLVPYPEYGPSEPD